MEEQPRLWGDKRYHTWNYHLRQIFGEKIFKVPLDAGFTCPNRDGKINHQGCIFCSSQGSGDYAGSREKSIEEQFHEIKKMMHKKWPSAKYIAYFQAYTNTYGPVAELRRVYYKALEQDNVVGLAISTRPDCLSDEILDLLEELNKKTFLWLELGLQSKHDKTLQMINRGHDYLCFLEAVEKLNSRNINICVHIILGLPGETRDDMLATALAVKELPIQGVKIHLLHLMQDTPMVQLHKKGLLKFLEQDEYISLVVDILEILPAHIVIHRLTGDSPREALIGPLWSLKKWEILNGIDKELITRDTWQGKLAE